MKDLVLGTITLDLEGFKIFLCDSFIVSENTVTINTGCNRIIASFNDVLGGSYKNVFWFAIKMVSPAYPLSCQVCNRFDLTIKKVDVFYINHSAFGSMYKARDMAIYISYGIQDRITLYPNPNLLPICYTVQ